jgi:hypothetical protein
MHSLLIRRQRGERNADLRVDGDLRAQGHRDDEAEEGEQA